jgi:hypothetical protein
MSINKVSQAIPNQLPGFIGSEYELFSKFIEYYYKSQEKTGLGQNILNNFLNYLDIDKLDVDILDGKTKLSQVVSATDNVISVESVELFLEENGSILIGDEVIFYEKSQSSPNISLGPGISYDQVKLKWVELQSPLRNFDGVTRSFPLTSQDRPIVPPSANHLIVQVYDEYLIPGVDFTVDSGNIVFTTAPRQVLPADSEELSSINFLSGFVENNIIVLDNISPSFGDGVKEFKITNNSAAYIPDSDEYILAYYDNQLLVPKRDFVFDKDLFIFRNFAPLSGRSLTLLSIEAPIPSFGSGASAYARIDDNGGLSSVKINETGSKYKFSNPPKITINSTGDSGNGGAAEALINGIKNLQLLSGGKGYSETNPPIVQIESPSLADSVTSSIRAIVTDGAVTALELDSSGSGYTFIPRITFKQPGGAEIGPVTIADGSISGPIPIISEGEGYTTPPLIYIDTPTGSNPINPSFTTVITDGKLTGITINNRGQGYTTTPRIKLIQPTGAQVLESVIDADGRLTTIELLDGGNGYEDVPSVYIIDSGTGTGATAVASIFNGRITDINVTNFGSGYDISNPPVVLIQSPPEAEASCEIGINQITGFSVLQSGRNYKKAQFIGCARASSGITSYDAEGNAVFSANTAASEASVDTEVKCLDALFIKRLLDKYVEQYLPDVPELDYKSIDVRTSIKTIKRFYETKGTEFSIAYLFKLLYGETVAVSYPKDQIIKPSAATWSINTILRATLVSGDPRNIQDALISQSADIADVNVKDASALVENYIAINTSNTTIYELVLSEETIQGSFIVPYKTKLAEPLDGETGIITVDSTIGWPERNGEFVIGTTEVVRYKEKSLNQFIECTRNFTGSVGADPKVWDSATEVTSNFRVYLNEGTLQEVVMDIVGIVDAQRTNLTDSGSYYLPGDKLTVAKLGGSSDESLLTTWLYNVKKLISVSGITFGGDNNQSATVTCSNPHGVLVGDQVTIYGANPIIYNGTFEVTSRDSDLIFQYRLPQTALVAPQGNILVSVDLNKGKSTDAAINKNISVYTTNVLNSFFNDNYVYVASTGIPNYNIGPFPGSALLPGNQRKLNRFPKSTTTISTKSLINPGPIGSWVNGVSVWSYKSVFSKTYGPLTSIGILNSGRNYDAASPPNLSITGGGGSGASASVVVNGSISNISVDTAGSGYTSSPLISIVGGGGSGAAATAIITKGTVSNILITNGGSGYTSQPSITIVGGEGSGATGTASVRGPIKEVNIQSQGSSYTSQPTVTLSSGSGAVAQAIINNGRIISVAIISAGSGYTTAPEVQIQGVGFGAQARAVIDTAGENAGRVTSIELLNRGINYVQGTTVITLVSVGEAAQFDANVFQWTYNLQESTTFDDSQGAVFEGYNNQYGGEYAHLSNPQRLRFILGDNLVSTNGVITEASLESNKDHSPIIGWAFDGTPIYGPYGYQDPTDQSSNIVRISTSYRLKSDLVVSPSNPTPIRTEGSLLSVDPAGTFVEDYEYVFSLGDLDQYNGRFCKTPEFPDGTYCYFVTIDSTEAGNPAYPYIIGPSFNSIVDNLNLSESAIQQNIPTGVVRYRDPYENVDIDVERTPNASTNSLTLEDGTLLLFDVEDENRDGIINQDETDDPDQILEEPPLQIYDYFPKVKTDSKVDIEVETISKFENASVTGFVIENSGVSYQVDDKLIFDNSETGGSGASARVSTIKGESIASYDFEYKNSENYGVLQTSEPHNLVVGDTIFVDYTENIETTNKQFVVRQLKGIETINVTQSGSGYSEDIPPTIIIDGDGVSGQLEAVVDSVGSVNRVNILNSGNGYTTNPRVILSHPQVFKKSDYYISSIVNEDEVIINDTFVTESKESYICGKTTDSSGDTIAIISKLSVSGVSEWNKTLKLSSGLAYTEFQSIYVENKSIWVVGVNKPNTSILDAYNPDIIICKYTESNDGLSATLEWQRAYAGISGGTRSDNVTKILRYGTDSLIISGYTNTNSTNPYDGFIAVVDSAGTFSVKRKLTSNTQNEKVLDIILGSDGQPYFLMETSTSVSEADKDIVFGKALVGVSNIDISWIRKVSNNVYSLLNPSIAIDEFDELYISATLQLRSNDINRENFWIGKFRSSDGVGIWSYSYAVPGRDINLVPRTKIDIFGNLNLVYTRVDNTTEQQTVANVKVDYKGKVLNHTVNKFTENNVEGIVAETLNVDNSGDVYIAGQTYWNRNEGLFGFDTDLSDTTGHHTMTTLGLNGSIAVDGTGGYLKIYGFQTGQSSTWENSAAKIPGSSLGNNIGGDFTIDFLIYKDDDNGNANTLSADYNTLIAIGDGEDTTGGIWLYYNTDGSANEGRLELVVTDNTTKFSSGTAAVSSQTGLFANDTWQLISLTKTENLFKVYVNGIEVISGTVANTQLGSKDIHFGNAPGFTTSGAFSADKQGQFFLDDIRIRNRYVLPTAPTDFGNPLVLPVADAVALAYTWTDTDWFTEQQDRYDLISHNGFVLKTDKNADAARLGATAAGATTQYGWTRTAVSPVTGNEITMVNVGYSLGDPGLQSLDYSESATSMTENTTTVTYFRDVWSSRTATVPSPGSQKLKVEASVADRYYFKTCNTVKIDNIQELTINQPFNFTVGSKLELRTGSTFVNSGYITSVDTTTNKVYLAVNNNSWSDDTNIGNLATVQFNEQSTYGLVGPIPSDNNSISYTFPQVVNTTPGTFDIDLSDYDAPSTIGGTDNLDEFAKFKDYADDDYSIRIDEVSGSSAFVVGSVINVSSNDVSYNSAYSTIQITNLTGVTKITLVANLAKILQVTAVANSDTVYVISDSLHYLTAGQQMFVDGNPTRTVSLANYDEYDGSFPVERVISPIEFTYKLPAAAVSSPSDSAATVNFFIKSPVLKMYYGHQYLFDLSHSSLVGGNLSFSKDPLYKLEYSFNSIERVGTPGVTGGGAPTPTVKLKVEENVITNISYYFDPSRTGADSPVIGDSYLDVTFSPYVGTFEVTDTSGGTITSGDNIFEFKLINQPEGAANIINTTYTTSSKKAVGSIGDIRIVNSGGFYNKLPIISTIQSTRNIERVSINAPGTEYAVGTYSSVPITGDGEGGLVEIVVSDGTDDEGGVIPGQIQRVSVTSPGKGYTTATIDIESISGILGAGLTGSGAELEVVIPSFGTGASIFTLGTEIGKIKNLKNNNFGFDYPHDYTLRPEISFPINAQLTNTSILDNIAVTDPGSGYTQAPTVVITGGGGSGAIAEATIKNGRLSTIDVKDPGSGYSSEPTVQLKSSFNYTINQDLGLLQFAFPHGIQNGSEITLDVVDIGDGAELPIASGAVGRLTKTNTYYAIAGAGNSLEDDQLKIAITAANAELGDALAFVNPGTGRQQVLTFSFGGAAVGNVITSTFLEGELVYQGDALETATATGYVSTNSGWQVGPRILKIVDYTGSFNLGNSVTGVISKSSGNISDLKIARGVLEVGPITKTTGQFIDDVGKPSEIVQKIQDSYYYQDFSYAVKSSVSISEWKDILIRNVHPASFKVFGELSINEFTTIPNKVTDFELTKSVELANEAIVPNIQNFTLVEPIYEDFNNSEILFRQKRLTSSENILTSIVQRVDDISTLFDGVRTAFPLTVNNGDSVIANANQLMVILNGVVQTPDTSFQIQSDSIVFAEAPQPPASVKYVNVEISQITTVRLEFTSISGIFPLVGNSINGVSSGSRLTVTSVVGNTIFGFFTEGTQFLASELVLGNVTGFSALFATGTTVVNNGLFIFGESIKNLTGDTATVEDVNLEKGAETPVAKLRYTVGISTTDFEVIATDSDLNNPAAVASTAFTIGDNYQIGSEIVLVNSVTNNSESTTINVTRAQLGTTSLQHQENSPFYGTDITITDDLILSKTTGTYQSTPGLFDIQLNDVIVASQSGVVARITSTAPYTDPTTLEVVEQVEISEGSTFFGLLFDRIASITYPNVVIDDISRSQVSVVEVGDNVTEFNSKFPENENVNHYIIPYDTSSGAFTEGEFIRNYKLEFGNESGNFTDNEDLSVRKLTLTNEFGNGFFTLGQTIRTRDTKAEVLGFNQAQKVVYLGKLANSLTIGTDAHTVNFNAGAQINTYNKKYGSGSLSLSKGTDVHTFVSGTADSISDGSLTYTAATGTTYDPFTGVLLLEIGAHALTTSDTVTIVDNTLIFTCGSDNNTNNYTYPRATDPASGSARAISAVTATTITVNVGAVPIDEYLDIATSSNFGFGTGEFTLECYIKTTTIATGAKVICDFRSVVSDSAAQLVLNGNTIQYNRTNGGITINGATTLLVDTWYHVAVSRTAGVVRLYLDGVQQGTDTADVTNYGTTRPVHIGSDYAGSDNFAGYIDEFRVSNIGRYSAAFTPRNGMFQGDTNTKLLLHFDETQGATSVQDWSGTEDFTKGEFFNNDAIKANTDANGSAVVAGFTGNSHRYLDAATLLEKNKNFIAKETVYLLTQQYPSLAIPGGNVNCEDDIEDIVQSIVEDLRNGSNSHIWDAAELYVDRTDLNAITLNHVETEIDETVWAYNKVGDIIPYIVNNVLWSVSGSHGVSQFTDTTLTDSDNTVYTQFTPTGATYDSATGDMVLTIGSHSLTTSDQISIAAASLTFTCSSDNNETQHSYPRIDDPFYNKVLAITAVAATTITVNVGISPEGQRYTHVFVSASSNAISKLNYSTGDCADVKTTADNLLDIVIDTLTNADLSTPVDHLGTITRVAPVVEFIGATVDEYLEIPFDGDYVLNDSDTLYTNKIDEASQYRFRDAANLINYNRTAIVDKAAADMISRYPDLSLDMPRNTDGSGSGTERCKQDLGLILDGIAKDIENGGNKNTLTAGKFYLGNNNEIQHVRLQLFQSIYAHERLGFYSKQAITGDLTTANTTALIIGDWGITNDAGNCANVQSAIDTLTTQLNDLIAPTGADFATAADRLYFNKEYIATEATGLTDAEFTYILNGITYRAFDYPGVGTAGKVKCERDLKLILLSAISDLQTGGTNSTIEAIELYLTANLAIDHIEEQLTSTIYAIERLRGLGISAIENVLYNAGSVVSAGEYAALYTAETAYRDAISVTDIEPVKAKFGELIDIAVKILSPAGIKGRYAAQQILFNKNYYKTELALTIDNEFGTGSWVYNDYVDGIIDNLSHDFVITDVTSGNTQQSRRIAVTKQGVISELQFTSGAGYRTTPTITIPAPVSGGITATATAVLEASGLIDTITIDSAGSGFDMPPVVIMSGSNVSNDGITATLSGGTVNSLTYDGRVFDADDFIGFGSGTEVTDSGSAIGTVGGFKTGVRHIKFGAASGTREATVSDTNTENLDTIRVYVIAGTGSNGAAAPGDNEDLKFQYSTDQGGTWTNAATLIYGGSNGGAQNYTNFSEITPVTVSVPVGAKTEATRFRIIQPTYTDGFLYDHYAVTRLGLVSNSKQFEGVVTLSFENAPSDSGTTTDPTATFSTLRVVENIIITERGRGYVPATPPTVTISGGSPDSAATITNVNVVLDTARFNKGETVTSSGGGTATVLEDVESVIFIGSVTGTLFADGDSLTGSISGTVADINVSGVGSEFDYYTNVGNIQTFADARLITSPIEGEFSTTNLYTNPEAFQVNWTQTRTTFAANTAVAPDGTLTADKLRASTDDASHIASRDYALASSNTFDDGSLTFDNSSNSFDEGSLSEGESQVYTISTFVKKGEYENVRFDVRLDSGTPGVQRLFFDVDLNNGDTGSIFQPQGGLIVKNRELLTVKEIVVNTRSAMTGTYTGVTGSSTGGLGGVFDIVIDHENAPNTAVVTVTDGGSAWIVDSEILIDGVSIGGVSGQDNLRFNVATTEPAGVGVIPYGNGWFRVYSTIEFSFGFSSIRNRILMRGPNNVPTFAGNGSDGIYLWGSKLNKGQFDAYTSVGGEVFYSNSEYNAKRYTLEVLESYLESALDGTLTSPAPQSTFLAFDNATWRAGYDTDPFLRIARENIDFYRQQLDNATYYVGVTQNSGIVVPSKEYGITYVPPGISGGLGRADFFYGLYSDTNAEIKRINVNEAKIAKVYKRFRIDGDITDGPFTMGEVVQKQGDVSITGTVYQFHEDENYKYLDVEVTAGTWQISDIIEGQENTTTATLSSIEDRLHVIKLVGDFTEDIPFLGYTSGQTAQPTTFLKSEAAVLDNSGGRLTVDTETLVGTFDKTAVVYGGTTDLYIEVQSYQGLDVTIGDRIISGGYVRFGVNSAADFTVGNYVYKYVGGKDASKRAIITGVDTDNNYVYVAPIDGDFSITEQIADFGTGGGGVNYEALATISTKITVEGGASARINNISAVGINKRLFLNEIVGAWTENDYVVAADNYKSVILDLVTSNARVKRASRGFDGVQTTFNLTINNGTSYLPDPAGHMLIFVNGILQPPGAGNAYNAFSDKIQFAEPPDIGSTFTGFYVGKLRQLDNIGFEFDSLRQSFNLKRDEVFYSLTLTEGVRSSTIRPENNIIVSLNGVIQEPGVGFSIVGSRIIFSEIPRVGSTFVAFSYVGSEADVDASEVVPPIEPGDLLSIEGETENREVAVIESSNSLITFDYLGSVFGQNAEATAVLTNGFIETVSITAPGSGYTSRPIVRVDSISGFNAQIRAIVGIANVEVNSTGSNYKNPNVLVESEVPDDWTAPNLADYGEEIIDPEVLP